ncbi:MAG: PIN domain-containing protein [Cytophagales bacterium]|nr:PIN domain-containing protein [Cytophagales bacterium]
MVNKVFVDTDVIIDFLIDRQPHAIWSSKIFNLADQGEVELYTSSLIINNIHYITRRIIGTNKSKEIILALLDLLEVLEVSKSDILNALKSEIKDFEDAIQHSVAIKNSGINSIITRNTKDYKHSKISVFSPEAFLKIIKNER